MPDAATLLRRALGEDDRARRLRWLRQLVDAASRDASCLAGLAGALVEARGRFADPAARAMVLKLSVLAQQAPSVAAASSLASLPPATQSGGSFADLYTVDAKPLAEGAHGAVHRGTVRRSGRPVAVKFLRAAARDDAEVRQRFEREAECLARLSEDGPVHVLPYYDHGLDEERAWLVVGLAEDGTLQDVLSGGRGPFSLRAVGPWLIQILRALEAVHAAGLVHRDLKPLNLLLHGAGPDHEPRPQVWLADFGVALWLERTRLTSRGMASPGTEGYAAPEQYAGTAGAQGPWTDLYSWGRIAFRFLTGRMAAPVQGDPRDLVPELPGAWAEAITDCLALHGSERPQTAGEVLRRLGE